MSLGFEVAHRMFAHIDMKYMPQLALRETGQFLLELDVAADEGMYFISMYANMRCATSKPKLIGKPFAAS